MATVTRSPSTTTKRRAKKRPPPAEQTALGPLWESSYGWFGVKDQFLLESGLEPLALHADWGGPLKIVRGKGCHLLRGEVFLPATEVADEWSDEDPNEGANSLRAQVVAGVFQRQPGASLPEWNPPPTGTLEQWLEAAGYAPTVDEQQNLRLTLKSRGCDGQVRIVRQPGRLRFTLELGRWPRLPPVVEQALLRLARRANDCVRLARIAWFAEGESRRCEAQVDLSGLPLSAESLGHEAFAMEMTRLAVASLELVLARLGLEFEILADPRHLTLAEELLGQPEL